MGKQDRLIKTKYSYEAPHQDAHSEPPTKHSVLTCKMSPTAAWSNTARVGSYSSPIGTAHRPASRSRRRL